MSDCCNSCDDPIVVSTPGPEGPAGAAGADGVDGTNAWTEAANYAPAAQPVMPAEGANVTVNTTTSTDGFAVGQPLYVQYWGTMEVVAVPTDTSITLKNLEDTALGEYALNAPPGTSLTAGAKITAGGWQGDAGAAGAGALLAANNLSDVAAAATSRTNLGLGTMATQNANLVAITGGSIAGITDLPVADGGTGASNAAGAQTNLGLVIGTNVQAYDAGLQSLSAFPTVADRYAYSTGLNVWAEGTITSLGRTILAAVTTAQARSAIDADGGYGLLAALQAVDCNAGPADNAMTLGSTNYRIDKIVIFNATISLTTATCGVFTAAGGAGTTLAADQAMSALNATTKFDDLTLAAVVGTDVVTSGTLYFRIGTPQGAAATCDVRIYGWMLD